MRIVVITANSERHQYFCHLVSNEFGHLFAGIVNQKPGSAKTRSRKHESFKDKSIRIINIMLNNPKMFLQKLNNKVQSKLNLFKRIPPQKSFGMHWENVGFPEVPIHMTQDVNSETTVKAIKDMKPDLIMVFGGKILKNTIIDIPKTIINMHFGITPFYKGAGSSITAIGRLDFRHVGATIHLIDNKIDHGNIINYYFPKFKGDESADSIQYKTIHAGLMGLLETAKTIVSGKPITSYIQPPYGKIYFSKGEDRRIATDKAILHLNRGLFKEYLIKSGELQNSSSKQKEVPPKILKSGLNPARFQRKLKKVVRSISPMHLENGVYIVLYHHISSRNDPWINYFGQSGMSKISTNIDLFEDHLKYYNTEFNVISLEKAQSILENNDGNIDGKYLVITFDDGYKSVGNLASPALEQYNNPYTFFVCGNVLLHKQGLARLRLSFLLKPEYLEETTRNYRDNFGNVSSPWNDFKDEFNLDKSQWVHDQWSKIVPEQKKNGELPFYFSTEELLDLQRKEKGRLTLGSHTYSHAMLSHLSPEEQKHEVIDCHIELENALEQRLYYFSYPFGGSKHFNHYSELQVMSLPHVRAVSAYGFVNKFYYPTNLLRISIGQYSISDIKRKFQNFQSP